MAALVQLVAGVDDAVMPDILASAKAQLADYKVPERMSIVAEIPRNTLGKTDRLTSLAVLTEAGKAGVTFDVFT